MCVVRIGVTAMRLCRAGGFALPLRSVVMFENLIAALKPAAGPDVFAAQWKLGSALPAEQALTQALALGEALTNQ